MKTERCSLCKGMGYYMIYLGDVEQDPRKITCGHQATGTVAPQAESVATSGVAKRNKAAQPLTSIAQLAMSQGKP